MKTVTKFDHTVVYTRHIAPQGDIRNALVQVAPTDEHDEHAFLRGETHEVVLAHECWTGYQWLQIVNRDSYRSFDSAVKAAQERVADLREVC